MRIEERAKALDFQAEDVFGTPISLERFKNKKVLLSFSRFTGCPICNLHVYELLQREKELQENNVIVVLISESSAETIKSYIENENLPFHFISDPEQILYDTYAVEKSWMKFFKWLFSYNGLYNAMKGFYKFNKFSSMQGSSDRVEAEFLIDEHGLVEKAHYGKMVGDYMPISNYL